MSLTVALAILVLAIGLDIGTRNIKFVCWFSRRFWDIHDYFVHAGGDGSPSHFYTYTCWHCGKRFGI